MGTLLQQYERALRAQGKSPATIADYGWGLRHLERHSGKPFLSDASVLLTSPDCWAFLEEMAGILSPASLKQILAAAKSWHKWGHSRELWPLNGIVSIPSPAVESDPYPPLDHEQVRWLLARAHDAARKRLLLLGLYTGTRVAEAAGVTADDWKGDRLEIVGKRRKRRQVPTAEPLVAARDEILSVKTTRRQLRWTFEKWQRETPFPWTTHALRRTFAQKLLDQRVPLEVVEALMGHAPRSTTLRSYARVPWEQKLEAVGRLVY